MLFSVLLHVNLCATGFNSEPTHALYLSVSEIEVLNDSLRVTAKVFSDDLYSSLLNFHTDPKSTTGNLVNEEVETYFNEKIKVTLGEHLLHLELLGLSEEGDSYFIHFASQLTVESEQIEIQLGYFYELFPSQRNILKLKTPSEQHHRVFKSEDQVEIILFTS